MGIQLISIMEVSMLLACTYVSSKFHTFLTKKIFEIFHFFNGLIMNFRRGVDKDPIVGLEVVTVEDAENPDVIDKTPYGHSANVNNATAFGAQPLYIKVRRDVQSPFVITDLVIILPGKGEEEPLGYSRLNENLNRGMVGTDVFICYKRRPKSVHRASYKPSILTRYV